nr:hypothetical protein [Streptomyces sp. WAC 01325]
MQQAGRRPLHEIGQLPTGTADLDFEDVDATGEPAKRVGDGCLRGSRTVMAQRRAVRDEPGQGQLLQRFSHGWFRVDQHSPELVDGLDASLGGRVLGDLQDPDGLDRTVAALGHDGRLPAQYGAGGSFRVDGIALAPPPTHRPVDLDDLHTGCMQAAGQAGAIGTRAFHSGPGDAAQGPGQQTPAAGSCRRERAAGQHRSQQAEDHHHVDVFVRVNPDDDLRQIGSPRTNSHGCHLPSDAVLDDSAPGSKTVRPVTMPKQGPYADTNAHPAAALSPARTTDRTQGIPDGARQDMGQTAPQMALSSSQAGYGSNRDPELES